MPTAPYSALDLLLGGAGGDGAWQPFLKGQAFSQGIEFCLLSLQMRCDALPLLGSWMHSRCDAYPNSLHRDAG